MAMGACLAVTLQEERIANARRINVVRFVGVSFVLVLFMVAGRVLGLRTWQGNLHVVVPYWVITTVFFFASRRSPVLVPAAGWMIALLDMPALFLAQWATFATTRDPAATAGYTMGIYVLLLVIQSLSLDRRAVYFTALVGAALEGALQHLAHVEAGAIVSTFVIMFLAAVCCVHGTRRITELIANVVTDFDRAQHAEQAVRERDEFLSIASHELRSPLTTLQLEVQGVLRASRRPGSRGLDDVTARRLATADAHAEKLGRLITHLLDVSRITAGRLQLQIEPTDLGAVVRRVVDLARPALARAHCSCSLSCEIPVIGRWDPLRVDQVVTNLVENAIKYGVGNAIEIEVTGDRSSAQIVVRDHGPGVAAEDQERIFRRFERAGSGDGKPGLGLGLWISREIVEAFGGVIRLESTPGNGAAFTVELPLHARPSSDAPAGHRSPPAGYA